MSGYDCTISGNRFPDQLSEDSNVERKAPVDGNVFLIENPKGINLMLITELGKIQTLFLPYPAKGKASFKQNCSKDTLMNFEADGGKWYAVCARGTRFVMYDSFTKRVPLRNQSFIVFRNEDILYMLYAEEVNADSFVRHNYAVLPTSITIGRIPENDIVYPGQMVSGRHAMLRYNGFEWHIKDLDSSNGTYVNGSRVEMARLQMGDVIDIFGLRIIIGGGFLSINDGNNRVYISPAKARLVVDTDNVIASSTPDEKTQIENMFSPFPRRRLAMEEKKIEIDNPPMPLGKEGIPLVMRMGSSLVMGGTAALTGNITMLASTLMLPLLTQGYTKEDKLEYERKRVEIYRKYLDEKEQEILKQKEKEENILRTNYPAFLEVMKYVHSSRKLWERTNRDDDFLKLRIGYGKRPLLSEICYSDQRFELEPDILKEEMYDLVRERVLLDNVPIMLDIIENFVVGLQGEAELVKQFVSMLIMRISVLFGYDEVKLILLAEESDLKSMEYIQYLPHIWDNQRIIRYIATNPSEAYQVGENIQKYLEGDLETSRKIDVILKDRPYFVVFALNKKLYEGIEVLKKAIQQKNSIGLSLIAAFPDVPKECSVLLNINGNREDVYNNHMIYLRELDREDDWFSMDEADETEACKSMKKLANIQLRLDAQAYALPKTLGFLEMYGVGKIEDLNIVKRWKDSNPVKSLAVPIGIGTDGADFTLDLHQKFQGPHGLVAGTTGSGKSEFLLTYILSLAVNYHPDEVAFLLIDYKGGGLAGAFDDPNNDIHLPHLIGTITNLDGFAINRSLVSIQSEMKRRQIIFNDAKSLAGEGTMDIYMYQRLYRSGIVNESMPHLFIISDEFAELKQQQPDFLDSLVSIARIGRSLGVHLILATQKPAGVVTDQILSNTKFRVCLKVQDRADSMDMLKKPDAADLRETGRFYLQVGNNEFYALGQSAWSGAEYEPQDEVVVKRDESIQVIDHIGSQILSVKPEVKKVASGRSQLVSIVKAIMEAAKEAGVHSRQLWLPVLPDQLDLDASYVEESDEIISAYIGRLDDPAKQNQYPMFLNLETGGHTLICGESGSGKTTFIQTLLYSLTRRYTPNELNFYILDYSSRLLKMFRKLPHCGAVLEEDDEGQIDEFFRLINSIIQERKILFSKLEVSNFSEARKLQAIPFVLVIIDNLVGFTQSKPGQRHYEMLQYYLKNSNNYGVGYLVTINHLNETNMRTRQEFSQKIALKMRDKYDYTDMLGAKVTYQPIDKPGCGLYNYEGKPLEMHLAMFRPELEQKKRVQKLKEQIAELTEKYGLFQPARKLAVMKPNQEYEEFMEIFTRNRIPLGYDLKSFKPVALPFKQFSQLSLYFSNDMATKAVLKNLITVAQKEEMIPIFVKRRKESCIGDLTLPEKSKIFETTPEDIENIITLLMANVGHRYNLYEQYCTEHELEPETAIQKSEVFAYTRQNFNPLMVIFEKFSDLVELTMDTSGFLKKLSAVFLLTKYTQIYLFACFYPNEKAFLWGNDVYTCFNQQKNILLFGNDVKRQQLARVPYDMAEKLAKVNYNLCSMQYKNDFHQFIMPCGEISANSVDEDDLPIFEER